MGIGLRYFVVKSDDMFERWSQARLNRVWDGDEPVPEFAGRRLRYALVFVETKERKVVGVHSAEWNVLAMDATGRHNPMDRMRDAVEVVGAAQSPYRSPIVDARKTFYERKAHWEPTQALRRAIFDAALRRPVQRQDGLPPGHGTKEQAVHKSAKHAGDSVGPKKKSTKRKRAFTAVLFQGDLVGENLGGVTDTLTSRFGLSVLAVASCDTGGGGRGEGAVREAFEGLEGEEAAQLASYELYEMSNHAVPKVNSGAELDLWASKRARELRKLADGLERDIVAKKRTALWNRAQKIRIVAERLIFGVTNWELEDEDKRWQAEHGKPD